MKLAAIGSKLRRDVQNFGVAKSAYEVFMEALNLCIYFRVSRVLRLETINPNYLDSSEPFRWQFFDDSTLYELTKNPENRLPERFVKAALAKGDECYGALDGDALASCGWFSNKPTDDDGLTLHFSSDYMYMYRGITLPKYRGKRLITIATHRALRDYLGRGFKGLLYCIDSHNLSCLKTLSRRQSQSQDIGRVAVFKLAGHAFVHNSRGCLEHGVYLAKQTATAKAPVLAGRSEGAAANPSIPMTSQLHQ